jgi:hypothetical protein
MARRKILNNGPGLLLKGRPFLGNLSVKVSVSDCSLHNPLAQVGFLPNLLLPVASSHFVAFLFGVLLGAPVGAVTMFGAAVFGLLDFVSHIDK